MEIRPAVVEDAEILGKLRIKMREERETHEAPADADAFLQAALAACSRGASSFEGYLTQYGSPAQFQRKLQGLAHPAMPSRISWTGPETPAGTVIVSFAP